MECSKDLIQFAHTLADASGAVIRPYFRHCPETCDKQDNTPVTIADREAEEAIRKLINQHYPDHGIIGEEYGIERENAEYKWVLDPIDGTISFMAGRPIFGTLISLVYDNTPILGIIDQPINKERWVGIMGQGTTLNGNPVKVRECTSLQQATICTSGPQYFNETDLQAFEKVHKQSKLTVYGGDCYNYALVATGCVDVVVEAGLKPHDFLALAPVVIAAGGVFTDWEGKEITLHTNGKVIAAGNRTIHQEVLQILS